jgi:DNA modification methylase
MIEPYYEKDGITIYNADCHEVLPELGRFDLLLTDPPYGIGADRMTLGNGNRKLYRGKTEWDSSPPERRQVEAMTNMSQSRRGQT